MDVKFIVDVGSNHNQDFNRTKKLIEQAAAAGAWGVKFQLYTVKKLYRANKRNLKHTELPVEWIPELQKICHENNVCFGCTPFDLEALDILRPYTDFFKISSSDILRKDLIETTLEYSNKAGSPFFISLGLYDKKAGKILNKSKYAFVNFMECSANYPAKASQCNFSNSPLVNGWSDHTVSIPVIFAAMKRGAKWIELHIDLNDKKGNETHYAHCWTIKKFTELMSMYNEYKIALESEYKPTEKMLMQRADPSDGLRPMKEKK